MLGKLSVALLLVASPALANDPAPASPAQEYTIKKVCRTVEVTGSFLPRTSCVNKKVPVKKAAPQVEEAAKTQGVPTDTSGESKDQ